MDSEGEASAYFYQVIWFNVLVWANVATAGLMVYRTRSSLKRTDVGAATDVHCRWVLVFCLVQIPRCPDPEAYFGIIPYWYPLLIAEVATAISIAAVTNINVELAQELHTIITRKGKTSAPAAPAPHPQAQPPVITSAISVVSDLHTTTDSNGRAPHLLTAASSVASTGPASAAAAADQTQSCFFSPVAQFSVPAAYFVAAVIGVTLYNTVHRGASYWFIIWETAQLVAEIYICLLTAIIYFNLKSRLEGELIPILMFTQRTSPQPSPNGPRTGGRNGRSGGAAQPDHDRSRSQSASHKLKPESLAPIPPAGAESGSGAGSDSAPSGVIANTGVSTRLEAEKHIGVLRSAFRRVTALWIISTLAFLWLAYLTVELLVADINRVTSNQIEYADLDNPKQLLGPLKTSR